MPDNVIDSLVVELGLDPSKLTTEAKVQAETLLLLRRLMEQRGKDIESDWKKFSETFHGTGRRLAAGVAALMGARSMKDFTEQAVAAGRAAGIMSDVTGIAVKDVSRWGNTFERMGGSAQGLYAVLSGIQRDIQDMTTGKAFTSSPLMSVINALNYYGVRINPRMQNGEWKRSTEILLEISEVLPRLNASKDAIVATLRRLPGMDDATISVMLKGKGALREYLKEQERIFALSDEDRRSADELTQSWRKLAQTAQSFGNTIVTDLHKPLAALFDVMSEYVKKMEKHHDFMSLPWEERDRIIRERAGVPVYTRPRGTNPEGGGSDQPPSKEQGDSTAVPEAVLDQAKKIALSGGPDEVARFMREQGYPKSGAWCGEFAAAVVKSVGGTPPKNPAIASNWRKFGSPVEGTPQPGDIAVRKGAPTGSTGSHVTIVEGFNPKTGTFSGIGGNQGSPRSTFDASRYDFRRGVNPFDEGAKPLSMYGPGALPGGRPPNRHTDIRNTTRVDVGSMTVNSQASDPAGIALDIVRELKTQQQGAN